MSRRSLSWPVSMIMVSLVVIGLVLAQPTASPYAAPLLQDTCGTGGSYPACTPTFTLTSTVSVTASGTPGSATATVSTATLSPTGATATTGTNVATATLQASATLGNTQGPLPTLPSSTPVDGAVACLPGSVVRVEGRGPPRAALLLYLDERPVGGGTSDAEGFFNLRLVIGSEKAGVYKVQARVRGTQRVLREVICVIPLYSPTPTSVRRRP